MHFIISGGEIDEPETAAALSAVLLCIEATPIVEAEAQAERWRDSARMTIQGTVPARLPATPRWNTIERLRRADRGGSGIIGL